MRELLQQGFPKVPYWDLPLYATTLPCCVVLALPTLGFLAKPNWKLSNMKAWQRRWKGKGPPSGQDLWQKIVFVHFKLFIRKKVTSGYFFSLRRLEIRLECTVKPAMDKGAPWVIKLFLLNNSSNYMSISEPYFHQYTDLTQLLYCTCSGESVSLGFGDIE